MKAAFDCYLPELAAKLGYDLPLEEPRRREFWGAVSRRALFNRKFKPTDWLPVAVAPAAAERPPAAAEPAAAEPAEPPEPAAPERAGEPPPQGEGRPPETGAANTTDNDPDGDDDPRDEAE